MKLHGLSTLESSPQTQRWAWKNASRDALNTVALVGPHNTEAWARLAVLGSVSSRAEKIF